MNDNYLKELFIDEAKAALQRHSGAGGGSGEMDQLINRSITEISSNINTIGAYAFYGCESLTNVNRPSATSVGDYAFRQCTALTTVELPSVTTIGKYGFYGCTSLTTVDAPKITSIGSYAFCSCSDLTKLILRGEAVCTLSNVNAFTSTPIADAAGYILVPRDLVATYQVSSNWTKYSAQFRALEDYTVDGTITGALDETKI